MPYAPRYSTTSQQGQLTLDEHLLWTVGTKEDFVAAHRTLAEARAVWSSQWQLVNTKDPSNAPEAFWIFHGPRTLQQIAKTALAKVTTHGDRIELDEQLEKRRRSWLAARGNDWREITAEATAADETKAIAHADDWTT